MRTIAYSILQTTDLRTGVTNLSPKTLHMLHLIPVRKQLQPMKSWTKSSIHSIKPMEKSVHMQNPEKGGSHTLCYMMLQCFKSCSIDPR